MLFYVLESLPAFITSFVVSISDAEFRALKKDVLASNRAAFSTGTRRNLCTQWRSFISFCLYFGLQYLPASSDTICLYAQFLTRTFKSVASVRNYLHGVKLLHIFSGFHFKHFESFEIKLFLKGLSRLHPHAVKQAALITPSILRDIHKYLDRHNNLHTACWAAFLLAFFLMLRKSNLVPSSLAKFDASKQLARKDILLCDFGLLVRISWSKTNQFGKRLLKIPILRIPASNLCPVAAFERLLKVAPAPPSAPAFTFKSSPLSCVTSYRFVRVLRDSLHKAGYPSLKFSGHSFRRGGATCAFRAGVPGELIQLHGDWQSDAYLRYLDFSFDSKLRVSAAMRDLICANINE